jgi:hypothetical protein
MSVKIDRWQEFDNGLLGTITGHPDPCVGIGPLSLTSYIIGKRNGKVVTETGTEYELGTPYSSDDSVEELLNGLDEV